MILLLFAGLLCLFLRAGPVACGPEAELGAVLSGRVVSLARAAVARVELRRLGDLHCQGSVRPWDRPYRGNAEPRDYERWLARGLGTGAPIAAVEIGGEAARFRFTALGVGLYEVRVVSSIGRASTSVKAIHAPGQRVEVDVALPTGLLTLRARLRIPTGEPFRGVVVAAQRVRGLLAFPYLRGAVEVEADETGLVVISGLHAGPCELTALVPGALRVRGQSVDLPFDGTYAWTVDTGPGLGGTLVAGVERKTPVAGAAIYGLVSGRSDHAFALARVDSDEHGVFRLPVGGPDTELLIVAPGFASEWIGRPDGSDLGTIRLDPAATIMGWVKGPGGQPLPGVIVHAEPGGSGNVERPGFSTRTDDAGCYVLPAVPPGEVRVFVRTDDWISPDFPGGWYSPYDSFVVEVLPGATRRVDLNAIPAARIRGHVRDLHGAGVAGALVRASGCSAFSLAVTGEDGRFDLRGLPAGCVFELSVRTPGQTDAQLERVPAHVDGGPVELKFDEAFSVAVTVVTADTGEAVVCARVRISQTYKTKWGEKTEHAPDGWTDAGGHARLGPIPRARAKVEVTAPGYAPALGDVMPGPDAAVRVRLERAVVKPRLTISGRIVAPSGVALGAINLRRSEPDEQPLGLWAKDGGTPVALRADGAFEVTVPGPGTYGLRAELHGDGQSYFTQTSAQAGAGGIEIHLRPVAWTRPVKRFWTFLIVDEAGRPIAGGTAVGAVRETQGYDEVQREFRAGRLKVEADHRAVDAAWLFRDAQDLCGRWLPLGPAHVGPIAPGGAPIKVVLPPEQPVHGVVVGPGGRGLRGVRVAARSLRWEDDLDDFHDRTTFTRGDGRFRLGGVGGGPYELRLGVPIRMARVQRFLLEAGIGRYTDLHIRLHIRLHEAVAPRITVRGSDGAPLAGADLRIEPEEGDFWTFDDNVEFEGFYMGSGCVIQGTDAEGHAGFTRLDPERGYVLWVRPPEKRADLAPRYFPAWVPRASQEIRLTPWATVWGVVQDAAGAPAGGMQVWVRQPGDVELVSRAESAADGTFAIDRLRPGAVALGVTESTDQPELDSALGLLHTTTGAGRVVLVVVR